MNFANHRDDRQPPPVPVVSPTGVWAHLIRLDGEEKHARIIELRGEEFRLGRRGDVDCMLHDPRISTKQLTFRYLDGRVTVQDSSSNGTCLNEDPFKGKTREIFHGDVIKFFQRVPLLSYRFDVNFKTQSMLTFESAAISAQAEAGNLSDYYLSDELSDVRIVVKYGDREQVDFPAHKLVIFAQSPVMKAMLSQPFQEKFENRIFLTDIEPEIVQALLFFMYKRQLLLNPEPIGVGLDGLATEPLSQSQLTTRHASLGAHEPTVHSSTFSVPPDSVRRSREVRGTALTPAKRSSSGGGRSSYMPSKKRRKTPARQSDAMQMATPNNKRSMSNEPMHISQTQSTHPDLDAGDQRSRSRSRAPIAMSRSLSRGQVHQRSNGHTSGRRPSARSTAPTPHLSSAIRAPARLQWWSAASSRNPRATPNTVGVCRWRWLSDKFAHGRILF
eukprot:98382_1